MPVTETPVGEAGYSPAIGLIYVFNLIVGTGALTMPAAFANAGWLVSLLVLVALSFMSFLTATFIIEAMSIANAVQSWPWQQNKLLIQDDDDQTTPQRSYYTDSEVTGQDKSDTEPLLEEYLEKKLPLVSCPKSSSSRQSANYFNIIRRIELGQMAVMFFNKVGVNLFYLCIAVYLYGDLAIYAATISKSMRDVTCTYAPADRLCNETYQDSDTCWYSVPVSRMNAYRLYVAASLILLGPFAFFNVQKTKYLQMVTSLMRWLAFGVMIIFAVIVLAQGKGQGSPAAGRLAGIPNLFGVCVYSFMCHHSLPSLITPIRNKQHIFKLLAGDYLLILGFYQLVSLTGIFAFANLKDVYTLNFEPSKCSEVVVPDVAVLQYFLALFPIFTLSTSFPIISITLRNNLKSLFLKEGKQYSFFLSRILFPLVAILPPTAIAFGTQDVEVLVGITGSYAGAFIQYVVPAILVFRARRHALMNLGIELPNSYASPFSNPLWILFVLLWATMCIIFVTANHIITHS